MGDKTIGVNPWTHIWFKPRETIREIIQYNPKFRFIILSFLYGLPMLLHMAQNISLGERFSAGGISIAALILATFVGMLGLTIASGLVYWTGKWIGGNGSFHEVRAAVSWSNVPNIVAIIIWAILIFSFKKDIFMAEFGEQNFVGTQLMLVSGSLIIQAILSIWSFIILVKGLGEAQGFSAWKGVLNVLIPFFMVGIVIWALSWIFWVSNGMPAAA